MANAATLTPPDTDAEQPESETPDTQPRFSIHDFTPEESPTLYDDAVQALIEAQDNENANPTGPNGQPRVKSITVLVPSDKKGKNKHLREFRAAAAKFDRTARVRNDTDQDDGTAAIEFTLTTKVHHRPRTAGEPEGADTPESE